MPNEIRKDYILDKWVIIATERIKRPSDFKTEPHQVDNFMDCPFCAGNEEKTPPATMLYIPTGKKILIDCDKKDQRRKNNWLIRVVPNLYPALKPSNTLLISENDLKYMNGVGIHEVIIETPNHQEQLHLMPDEQIKLVFRAYKDRFSAVSSKENIRFVSIFRNYGMKAGTSLSHPHSQLIAIPIVPPIINEEIKRLNYLNGKCAYDKIIEKEKNSERFIYENDSVVAFCPFASITPFEVWIFVKRHVNNIVELTDKERDDFAIATRDILAAIFKILQDIPYNYAFWQTIDEKEYHMHMRIFPRLTIYAGFEYNTNIFVNPVPPEYAAKTLREALKSKV